MGMRRTPRIATGRYSMEFNNESVCVGVTSLGVKADKHGGVGLGGLFVTCDRILTCERRSPICCPASFRAVIPLQPCLRLHDAITDNSTPLDRYLQLRYHAVRLLRFASPETTSSRPPIRTRPPITLPRSRIPLRGAPSASSLGIATAFTDIALHRTSDRRVAETQPGVVCA